jgi:enoyl-CoA hydratase/carnithine racemase
MGLNDITVKRERGTALVQFDRKDDINALSADLMKGLIEVAHSFEDDLETTAVVLTGSAKAFSAGMDLRDPAILEAMVAPLGRRRRALTIGPALCDAWESLEQVTICAIEGHCVGGGVSLAVSCDFRIMGEGAHFRVPELQLGMNMSWRTIPRMVHLVGPARTKEIIILAERISAAQALTWGLAQEVAPDGEVVGRALAMAKKAAALPPLPVRMTKEAVNAATNALDFAAGYMDRDQFMLCQMTQDHAEAVASFGKKEKPTFKGE